MYELPIPLSGHCVVVLNDKMVVFLGGGTGCPWNKPIVLLTFIISGTTKFKEEDGSVIPMTGPIPSDHVHSYNLDSEVQKTIFTFKISTNWKREIGEEKG